MATHRPSTAVSPEQIQAEIATLLAQLGPDGTAPRFAGATDASLVIPPWMVPHILNAPQEVVGFLHEIKAAGFPQRVFQQSAHLDPHRTASYVFNSLQGRDPKDVQGNKELIAKLMLGLGVFAGLAMLIALSAAIIFMKLGPVGVVFGVIAILIGFVILLAVAAIMVVIAAVMAIIGYYNVAVTVAVAPEAQAAGG